MNKLIDDLFTLQDLVRIGEAATPEQRQQIESLRAHLPAPVTAHFFRQLANGRRGVVQVRNGVCGGCHLRLSTALVHVLARTNDLMVCESCGAFIALAPDAQPVAVPKARRFARKLETAACG